MDSCVMRCVLAAALVLTAVACGESAEPFIDEGKADSGASIDPATGGTRRPGEVIGVDPGTGGRAGADGGAAPLLDASGGPGGAGGTMAQGGRGGAAGASTGGSGGMPAGGSGGMGGMVAGGAGGVPPLAGPPVWQGGADPMLVVVGNGGRRMWSKSIDGNDASIDATSWKIGFNDTTDESSNDPSRATTLRGLAYGSKTVVAVGGSPMPVPGGASRVMTFDGREWRDIKAPDGSGALYGVAHGIGTFVAVGDAGPVIRSTDAGRTWEVTGYRRPARLRAIAFGRVGGVDMFVAGGDGYSVATSEDGKTWQTVVEPLVGATDGFRSIAIGGDCAVLVGGPANMGRRSRFDGKMVIVGDPNGGPDVTAVTYAAGQFIAYASSNAMFTSTDGLHWTRGTSVNAGSSSVAYGNVAVKWTNKPPSSALLYFTRVSTAIRVSMDGISWSAGYITPTASNDPAFNALMIVPGGQ